MVGQIDVKIRLAADEVPAVYQMDHTDKFTDDAQAHEPLRESDLNIGPRHNAEHEETVHLANP